MKTELAETEQQVKEYLQPPEAGRGKEEISGPSGRRTVLLTP